MLEHGVPLPVDQDLRDVGQMKSGRRWKDVLKVLGSRFLEAMKWGVGIILGQTLVIQPVPRQSHCLMFGQRHPYYFPIHLLSVQVAHCCGQNS